MALEPLGYRSQRADELDQSGLITTQIIDCLLNNDLVVADLTDHNPNVFYELAIRHATGKPYIQLILEGQKLPFDVQGVRTVQLDHHDLDSVAAAITSLQRMVQNAGDGSLVDSPLTHALDIQSLKQSGSSEERGIADILVELQSMKQALSRTAGSPKPDPSTRTDFNAVRSFLHTEAKRGNLTPSQIANLMNGYKLSDSFRYWLDTEVFRAAEAAEPPF